MTSGSRLEILATGSAANMFHCHVSGTRSAAGRMSPEWPYPSIQCVIHIRRLFFASTIAKCASRDILQHVLHYPRHVFGDVRSRFLIGGIRPRLSLCRAFGNARRLAIIAQASTTLVRSSSIPLQAPRGPRKSGVAGFGNRFARCLSLTIVRRDVPPHARRWHSFVRHGPYARRR